MVDQPSDRALQANRVIKEALDAAMVAFEAVLADHSDLVVLPPGAECSLSVQVPGQGPEADASAQERARAIMEDVCNRGLLKTRVGEPEDDFWLRASAPLATALTDQRERDATTAKGECRAQLCGQLLPPFQLCGACKAAAAIRRGDG